MSLKAKSLFNLTLLAMFSVAFFFSLKWPAAARYYPEGICLGGIIFTVYLLIMDLIGKPQEKEKSANPKTAKKSKVKKSDKDQVTVEGEIKMFLWMIAYFALILVFGFWVAIAVTVPVFMRKFGNEGWKLIGIFTVFTWLAIFLTFHVGMEVSLFGGVLGLTW